MNVGCYVKNFQVSNFFLFVVVTPEKSLSNINYKNVKENHRYIKKEKWKEKKKETIILHLTFFSKRDRLFSAWGTFEMVLEQ